jgi:hypothetical protein
VLRRKAKDYLELRLRVREQPHLGIRHAQIEVRVHVVLSNVSGYAVSESLPHTVWIVSVAVARHDFMLARKLARDHPATRHVLPNKVLEQSKASPRFL